MASLRAVLLLCYFSACSSSSPCDVVATTSPCTPARPGPPALTMEDKIGIGLAAGVGAAAVTAGGVALGGGFDTTESPGPIPGTRRRRKNIPMTPGRLWTRTTTRPRLSLQRVANTTSVFTTTMTAVDSSASSGSGKSLDSLVNSFGSGPAGSSSFGDSFNTGSSASDSSGSATSGSTASGSWGSQLQIWQWLVVLPLLCCCLGGGGAAMMGGKKKPKKKTKSKKPTPAAPVPVAEAEIEPLLVMPPLMPLATTSQLMPSYSMVQQMPQQIYTYAAPATTAFAAPQAYAQPAIGGYAYAAPATTAYAQPMQAYEQFTFAPGTTSGMVV